MDSRARAARMRSLRYCSADVIWANLGPLPNDGPGPCRSWRRRIFRMFQPLAKAGRLRTRPATYGARHGEVMLQAGPKSGDLKAGEDRRAGVDLHLPSNRHERAPPRRVHDDGASAIERERRRVDHEVAADPADQKPFEIAVVGNLRPAQGRNSRRRIRLPPWISAAKRTACRTRPRPWGAPVPHAPNAHRASRP